MSQNARLLTIATEGDASTEPINSPSIAWGAAQKIPRPQETASDISKEREIESQTESPRPIKKGHTCIKCGKVETHEVFEKLQLYTKVEVTSLDFLCPRCHGVDERELQKIDVTKEVAQEHKMTRRSREKPRHSTGKRRQRSSKRCCGPNNCPYQ